MSTTIELKEHPEVARVIRAAAPSYKRHKAIIIAAEAVSINDTAWDGGSRSTYTAVNMDTGYSVAAPQYAPPQFGGKSPTVAIPAGVAMVRTGIFRGKTATVFVYVNPANMAKLLPNSTAQA